MTLEAFAEEDTIQPGKGGLELPYATERWFGWALAPAEDEEISELVALGRGHARQWLEAEAVAEAEAVLMAVALEAEVGSVV